jgi:hypothetical protein
MPVVATESSTRQRRLLAMVKTVHTAIWFSVEVAVVYLLYTGITRRSRGVGTAAGIVAAECAVFLVNGASCPLTGVAESLGAHSGSVTDLYLPAPVAKSLPAIHVPIVALILYLHRDRLWRLFRRT